MKLWDNCTKLQKLLQNFVSFQALSTTNGKDVVNSDYVFTNPVKTKFQNNILVYERNEGTGSNFITINGPIEIALQAKVNISLIDSFSVHSSWILFKLVFIKSRRGLTIKYSVTIIKIEFPLNFHDTSMMTIVDKIWTV